MCSNTYFIVEKLGELAGIDKDIIGNSSTSKNVNRSNVTTSFRNKINKSKVVAANMSQ